MGGIYSRHFSPTQTGIPETLLSRIYASHPGGLWTSQYVARSSDAHALYSVLVHRLAHLLDASFRSRLAAIALASSLTLHLHQVGQRICRL
jgi:hypothetical protein